MFFIQQKDWVFCIGYFWRMKCKSTKKITERCFSCQNKLVCQKLARSCKKWKSAKNRYTPFLHEGLQLDQRCHTDWLNWMPNFFSICPPLLYNFKECIGINCWLLLWLKGIYSYIRNATQPNIILLRQMSSGTWLFCPVWLCNAEHITQCWDDCLQVKLGWLCQICLKLL